MSAARVWLLAAILLPLGSLTMGIDACGDPDPCPGDADADGVCDDVDVCPGADDGIDLDVDGVADGCDLCPADPLNDANNDGICDGAGDLALAGLPPELAILPRDDTGRCQLDVRGTTTAQAVRLDVDVNGAPATSETVTPGPDGSFRFGPALMAGLNDHDLRLDVSIDGAWRRAATRASVACGDFVFIQGQSNAVAGDYHSEHLANQEQSHWVRSFGTASVAAADVPADLRWDLADGEIVHGHAMVGAWGLKMARILSDRRRMPIAVLNGAVGGTTIAQHQRDPANPENLDTIYGRFLYRARAAGMDLYTPVLLWYQGESDGLGDQAAYLAGFEALRAAWQEDFPSLSNIYVYQVRLGCGLDLTMDGALSVEFRDSNGRALGTASRSVLGRSGWMSFGLQAQVPTGATSAVLSIGSTGYFALAFDDASLQLVGGSELLTNPSFEAGAVFPDGWSRGGAGVYTLNAGGAHGGNRWLQLDSSAAPAVVYQQVPVTAGTALVADVWAHGLAGAPVVDVRETLRGLPNRFDDVTLLTTVGAPAHDGCHFAYAGYAWLGEHAAEVLDRDLYGAAGGEGVDPASVVSASWEGGGVIRLRFNAGAGPLTVFPGAEELFWIDGAQVVEARSEGEDLLLTLDRATSASALSFVGHLYDGPDVVGPAGVGMADFLAVPVR